MEYNIRKHLRYTKDYLISKKGTLRAEDYFLLISKLEDEWYVVFLCNKSGGFGDIGYKCDQFNGLLECLKFLLKKENKQY